MCGRFVLFSSQAVIADAFNVPDVPELFPRYNVAPSQSVAAIRSGRSFAFLKWGLSPGWMKTSRVKPINAQAETAPTRPMFRSAFKKRRAIIPADGWYEWKSDGKKKQPYLFGPKDGRPLGLAGVWESFEEDGELIETCALLTTTANELAAEVHGRMPCILAAGDYDAWLDGGAPELLRPFPAELLVARKVSSYVSKAGNEGPECVQEVC
jgi:putative SOS response-associated peptidase YedK